jgi:DNA polymerase III subunit delta'
MTLQAVQGQSRAVGALRAALRRGALPHACLFTGPSGVGKELAAVGLTQALLCREAPGEGCGRCSTCTRVERFAHPDVLWLLPEEEQVRRRLAGRSDFAHVPSRDVRVEQVRKLQERLSLRGLESATKVVLVLSAEAMNPAAQNAFLKTLEEPPQDTTLVLVTSAPDRLLPTLRSRCVRYAFAPLPRALVAARLAELRGLQKEQAQAVAALAEGSLERALALSLKPEQLENRRATIRAFEAVNGSDFRSALRFAEVAGGSREEAEEALGVLFMWVRDVAVVPFGQALFHPELHALATAAAQKLDEDQLHWRFRLLDEALVAIRQRNASPRLQLERLALEMSRSSRGE